jgi:hypothetical protein
MVLAYHIHFVTIDGNDIDLLLKYHRISLKTKSFNGLNGVGQSTVLYIGVGLQIS